LPDRVEERSIREWLGQVDAGPAFSGRGPGLRGIVAGDQDHGDGRNTVTGVARHGQPINPGEPEIGHHQIRPLAIDQRDRVRPGMGPKGHVARARENPLTVRDEIRLVIDDQDGPSHLLSSVDRQEQSWCQGQVRGKGPGAGPGR
jgi:hypothetical protein